MYIYIYICNYLFIYVYMFTPHVHDMNLHIQARSGHMLVYCLSVVSRRPYGNTNNMRARRLSHRREMDDPILGRPTKITSMAPFKQSALSGVRVFGRRFWVGSCCVEM